jgi:hypothetical protein
MLPDDPIEFLSEYLYKKSFEVDKDWKLYINYHWNEYRPTISNKIFRLVVWGSHTSNEKDGTKLVTRLKQINDSLQSEEPEDVEYINKKLQDSRTQFMSTSN